jgi:hypothetical protein
MSMGMNDQAQSKGLTSLLLGLGLAVELSTQQTHEHGTRHVRASEKQGDNQNPRTQARTRASYSLVTISSKVDGRLHLGHALRVAIAFSAQALLRKGIRRLLRKVPAGAAQPSQAGQINSPEDVLAFGDAGVLGRRLAANLARVVLQHTRAHTRAHERERDEPQNEHQAA